MHTTENAHIKMEPDGDVEIGMLPVCRELSVRLTDCRKWLQGQDFLFLGEIFHFIECIHTMPLGLPFCWSGASVFTVFPT